MYAQNLYKTLKDADMDLDMEQEIIYYMQRY